MLLLDGISSLPPCCLLCSAQVVALAQASSGASQAAQKTFATPKQAVDALIQAAGSYDLASLQEILGPESKNILSSEDTVRDKNNAAEFAAKARQKNEVTVNPRNPKLATLSVAMMIGPFPSRSFRRVGSGCSTPKPAEKKFCAAALVPTNWMPSKFCRGYVDAQREYAMEKHDDAEVNQYAPTRHQYTGKARRPCLAETPMEAGRTRRGRNREGSRAGLHGQKSAVPWLLLQDPERPGPAAHWARWTLS